MVKIKKFAKLAATIFIVFVIARVLSVHAAEDNIIKIKINGEENEISPKILNRNGKIYIPLDGVSKFLYGSFTDYSVDIKKIIAVNRYGSVFTNQIDTDIISVNGGKIKIAYSSFRESGDSYVTVEFLSTVFGITSKFDDKTNTVIIWQTKETDVKKLPRELQDLSGAMMLSHYQPEYLERYIKYKKLNPDLKYYDVVTRVNIGLDFPFYSSIVGQQVKNPESNLVLCNKYNYLPGDYVPEGYKKTDGRILSLRGEAQEQFARMRRDASKSGLNIYIVSAYRSYAVQNQIFNNYKRRDPNGAETYSARPGYSEHQTGLAADLNLVSANFENTKEYAWLTENAHIYGFILRYPKGMEWMTGYVFEPWHWRYVGVKTAESIKELGITYDEYHAIYLVPQNAG